MLSKKLVLAFVTTLIASPVMAASITVTSIDGDWENASAPVAGQGSEKIRWGSPLNSWGKRSGYDFDAAGETTVEDGASFVLGTFTHLNFPIKKAVLFDVDLSLNILIDGVANTLETVFSFDHWETPNGATVCANGDGQRVGVNNKFGCADNVSISQNDAISQTFDIDGTSYYLDITGFRHNGEEMTDFWTRENQRNTAEILGTFRAVSPSEVPLPATGFLLLGGLAGMVLAKRRRS